MDSHKQFRSRFGAIGLFGAIALSLSVFLALPRVRAVLEIGYEIKEIRVGSIIEARADLLGLFQGALVVLSSHDEQGTIGIVLSGGINDEKNWLSYQTSIALLNGAPAWDGRLAFSGRDDLEDRLIWGGPLSIDRIYLLALRSHAEPLSAKDGWVSLRQGLWLLEVDSIEQAIEESTALTKSRIVVGSSGWGPGQLEREFRDSYWRLSYKSSKELFIFND